MLEARADLVVRLHRVPGCAVPVTHPAVQQVGDPPPTTADLVDLIPAEQQQVLSGATACLAVCDTTCHAQVGTLTCVRVQHPHTAQNCVVHAAYVSGTLIQWVHIRP